MILQKNTLYTLNQNIKLSNSSNHYEKGDFAYVIKTGKSNEIALISSKNKDAINIVKAPNINLLQLSDEQEAIFKTLPLYSYWNYKKGDSVRFKEYQVIEGIIFIKGSQVVITNPKIPFKFEFINPENINERIEINTVNPCNLLLEKGSSLVEESLSPYIISGFKTLGYGHDSEIYTGTVKSGKKKVFSFSDDGWGAPLMIDVIDKEEFNHLKNNLNKEISLTEYSKDNRLSPDEAIEFFVFYLKEKLYNNHSFSKYLDTPLI